MSNLSLHSWRNRRFEQGRRAFLVIGMASTVLAARAFAASTGDWQGEWGAWTQTASETFRGASASIAGCDSAEKHCRLRFEIESGAGTCLSSGDHALAVADDGTASAVLRRVDGADQRCEVALKLAAGGDRPAITAELVGPGCGYFCTSGPLTFGTLPRASVLPYPESDRRACFADRRGARQIWCTTEALQARERELASIDVEIESVSRVSRTVAEREARLSAMVADCQRTDNPATILPCLGQHVDRALLERKAALAKAQEARARADAELAAPGDPVVAGKRIASVQGVYKKRFANQLVDGSTFESEDILELVAVRPGALYFRTHLEFYNGHVCELSGLASWRRAGVFVYEGPVVDEDPPCRLQVAVGRDAVRLVDADQTCKMYCGARGSFDGETFPLSARREIRYLDRLKRSREYREAVGEPDPRR